MNQIHDKYRPLKFTTIATFPSNHVNPADSVIRIISKRLTFSIFTLLLATGLSFAQNSANTTVAINATVIQGLTLSVSGGPLNFGTVVAGTTPASISAQSSSVLFTASGNGGNTVTVTYSGVTLNGPSGATLSFTPSVYGYSSASGQSSSTNVPSGSTINLNGTTGSTGYYYLWLGGSLGSLPVNQKPGSYTGTFTMTVSY